MNRKIPAPRHIRWQVLIISLGVVILATLLIYVALTFTSQPRPGPGGTYIEGMVGQVHAINPLLCQLNDVDRDLCALVFNGLLYLDKNGVPQPDLAARPVEISPDGLVYTVTLRTNVRWQDGQPLTADDVLFTINLLKNPDFPGPQNQADLWRTVEVSRVNPYNVSFTLQEPFAPFPDYLTLGILPEHILRNVPVADFLSADFNLHPIGTGPFKVEEVGTLGGQVDHILLAANSQYFSDPPFLDRVEIKFYADDNAVFSAYRAGQVQGIAKVAYADLPRLREYPKLNVFSAPLASYTLIFFNLSSPDVPFFQDKPVRQALSLALDRQKIIDQALGGNGIVVRGPILPDTWAFDPTLPIPQPDLNRARALLDSAGWKVNRGGSSSPSGGVIIGSGDIQSSLPIGIRAKDGRALAFTLLTSNDSAHLAMAQLVADQWLSIGVTVTVRSVPMLVTNYLEPRSYEAVLIDLSLPGDPDPYPFWHETQVSGGQNYSGHKDRDISEILEQARRTNDQNVRREFYQRFQKTFMDDVPAILLSQPIFTFGVDDHIRGVQIGPLEYPSDRFRTVGKWYIVTRRVIASSR